MPFGVLSRRRRRRRRGRRAFVVVRAYGDREPVALAVPAPQAQVPRRVAAGTPAHTPQEPRDHQVAEVPMAAAAAAAGRCRARGGPSGDRLSRGAADATRHPGSRRGRPVRAASLPEASRRSFGFGVSAEPKPGPPRRGEPDAEADAAAQDARPNGSVNPAQNGASAARLARLSVTPRHAPAVSRRDAGGGGEGGGRP